MEAADALARQVEGRRGQQFYRLQKVVSCNRHHDVDLEVTRLPGNRDGGIVSNNMCRDLAHRLWNHWIDLARHDGASWLDLRQQNLANACPRPRAQPSDIVADLHQADGNGLQCPAGSYDVVQRTLSLEVVGCLANGDSKHSGQPIADTSRKLGVYVHACPYRSASEGDFGKLLFGAFNPCYPTFDLTGVADKLLSKPDRRGVLEVGPSCLQDWHELLALLLEFRLKFL